MVFAEQYQALCQEYTDILYLSGHFIYLNPLLFDPLANFKQVTFYDDVL